MRYSRETGNGKGRRRLILLLFAVIALSLRMISQEGQLSESRLVEEHTQAIREFGPMVTLAADRYRSEVRRFGLECGLDTGHAAPGVHPQ